MRAVPIVAVPRLRLAGRCRWPCCLLLVALVAGCHGGPATDIYERELRWQEDQIYALKNYLNEYDHQLRQYRRENAKLKKQQPTSQPSGSIPPGTRDNGTEEVLPDLPEIEIGEPATPPQSKTDRQVREDHSVLVERSESLPWRQGGSTDDRITPVSADDPPPEMRRHVAFHGEVQPGEDEDLLIAWVELQSRDGNPLQFDGEMSLMLLDPAGPGPMQRLARWDYSRDEIAQIQQENPDTGIQCHLMLPPEIPSDRPLEVWVRLVDPGGTKWLSRADLQLDRSLQFASIDEMSPARFQVVAEPSRRRPPFSWEDENWTIAWPGHHASDVAPDEIARAHWRPTDQPIPMAIGLSNVELPETNRDESQSRERPIAAHPLRHVPPNWSPERNISATHLARPGWSHDRDTTTTGMLAHPEWSPQR